MSMAPTFEQARTFLGFDRNALLTSLGGSSANVQPAAYGPSKNLEAVYIPTRSPARYYLQEGKVILAYFSGATVDSTSPAALSITYPGAIMLASRAGKEFTHHVDAVGGIAWSDDGTDVAFVEVFQPMDIDRWKALFYQDPGVFYK